MTEEDKSSDNVAMEENKPATSMFTLKKWNAVAMWSWDVQFDTCAICRVQIMGKFVVDGQDVKRVPGIGYWTGFGPYCKPIYQWMDGIRNWY